MKHIYDLKLPYLVDNFSYLQISRPKNHVNSFNDGRPQNAFLHTLKGKIAYTFSETNQVHIVNEGETFFIPAGVKHTTQYLQENNTVGLLQFDVVKGALPSCLNNSPIFTSENFSSVFRNIWEPNLNNPIYTLTLVSQLLWLANSSTNKISNKFIKLLPVITEIEQHYYENYKIDYYAKMCNMSEAGFRRLFHEYTQLSPIEYRNVIRLKKAKQFIQCGEYTVEEAANEVGIYNLSFFYRLYKKYFGSIKN
jgi:AraC-like DNA-binding protein